MNTETTVAVLGAGGIMGRPMAANLARAGLTVRAWNRTREKAEGIDGATVHDSPSEAIEGADVVLTMLSATDAVLDAVADGLSDGVTWLQMSTIGIDGTERCAELAAERGAVFVDAPVLGTKQPAIDGKLLILASGPAEQEQALAPILDAVGARTMWLGDAGAGSRLKLVANSWVLSVVEATAESLALADALGTDPQLLLDAVAGGALDLPYLQMKGKAIIARDFEPAFRLELAAKDAGLVVEAAERHGADLPLHRAIRDQMRRGAEQHPDEDMSATYLTAIERTTG